MDKSLKPQMSLESHWLFRPMAGTILTLSALLSFQFLCMILPLVGPSGAAAPHAAKNFVAFLFVLLLTMGLAALSIYSKMMRRKMDASPWPWWTIGLMGICLVIFVALFAGRLSI